MLVAATGNAGLELSRSCHGRVSLAVKLWGPSFGVWATSGLVLSTLYDIYFTCQPVSSAPKPKKVVGVFSKRMSPMHGKPVL